MKPYISTIIHTSKIIRPIIVVRLFYVYSHLLKVVTNFN
nr:MAG TPA: hypothetical protein [Caudoviricetes sp.]